MTKAELVDELAERNNLSKVDMEKIVTDMIETISAHALGGGEVRINGFGKFSQKVIRPRTLSAAMGGGVTQGRTTVKFKSYL